MLDQLLGHSEAVIDAPDAEAAGNAFVQASRAFGPSYIQIRLYNRPTGPLTSEKHYDAGGHLVREGRDGWVGSTGFHYICFECNPLLAAVREHRTRYRLSDFAPHHERKYGDYWDALNSADISDVLCSTSYGRHNAIASVHLGFPSADISRKEAFAIQMAELALTERLLEFSEPAADECVELTPRERDCILLVAEGKTDWEISVIWGISEATARFHVDNVRKKLGAVNRAHAIARAAALRLF